MAANGVYRCSINITIMRALRLSAHNSATNACRVSNAAYRRRGIKEGGGASNGSVSSRSAISPRRLGTARQHGSGNERRAHGVMRIM